MNDFIYVVNWLLSLCFSFSLGFSSHAAISTQAKVAMITAGKQIIETALQKPKAKEEGKQNEPEQ